MVFVKLMKALTDSSENLIISPMELEDRLKYFSNRLKLIRDCFLWLYMHLKTMINFNPKIKATVISKRTTPYC